MTAQLHEDRAWLMAFRRGDRGALERVFRTYVAYVAAIIRRGSHTVDGRPIPGVADATEQQDLLHDVFVKAFSPGARQAYDGLRPYAPYLAQVARNVLAERGRALARDKQRWVPLEGPADEEPVQWAADEPLPEDLLLSREQQQQGAQFKEQLSPAERDFVAARFERGLSQRDAADQLGVTRHRIRDMEQAIMLKLRGFLSSWRRPGKHVPPKNDPTP